MKLWSISFLYPPLQSFSVTIPLFSRIFYVLSNLLTYNLTIPSLLILDPVSILHKSYFFKISMRLGKKQNTKAHDSLCLLSMATCFYLVYPRQLWQQWHKSATLDKPLKRSCPYIINIMPNYSLIFLFYFLKHFLLSWNAFHVQFIYKNTDLLLWKVISEIL